MSSNDIDPVETAEWQAAFESVVRTDGAERAQFILSQLMDDGRHIGYSDVRSINTPYINTIPPEQEVEMPGDDTAEKTLRAVIRWNALAMVGKAQSDDKELGGHVGSFASSSMLYDVGFNHFWRAPSEAHPGDLIYYQGHIAPGIYARSYVAGDFDEDKLENFRQEVDGKGICSYPHPWLMPDYWQFATVSMGLGPLQAIYQARFMRYLEARKLKEPDDRKVWCFCGDGEMDEPESLGAISLPVRERLDNLIFVINCNLQRLDGPVRGNGKIIQELEAVFRGAGWNVIKLVWGNGWDRLLAKDKEGHLLARMEEAVDGEYQNYKAYGGAYVREHFFGKSPELLKLVEDMSDDEIWRLNRGGHDPKKIFNAFKAATEHKGAPTVILAKTVKGHGLGPAGEAKNTAHNTKKFTLEDLKLFRERYHLPLSDDELVNYKFYRPDANSPEGKYIRAQRDKLGGKLPHRRKKSTNKLSVPPLSDFEVLLKSSGDRKISTTMALVRFISSLAKDKKMGKFVVPIVPDEARTFGMEGMFRQVGIYSADGQKYKPVDADQVMYYKESANGQMLQEGINEAGSFCSWLAAATSYSTTNLPMVPFYIYYSMFGHQRIGDLAWAGGDMRAKGFLIGATSGRTTLNGEGLQHQDGHSHLIAGTIPTARTYDPTFSYELAVILQHGLVDMYVDDNDVHYYVTTMNENYYHPEMPQDAEEGIIRGLYRLSSSDVSGPKVQLMGCGTILNEAIEASKMLAEDFGVSADIWSVTSFNELIRDARAVERDNHLNPTKKRKLGFAETLMSATEGPIIVATDYVRAIPEQLRSVMPGSYKVLGTDGFGRSDTRAKLRHFFEVDRFMIAYSAMKSLFDEGAVDEKALKSAMKKYKIDSAKVAPWTV